MSRIRSFRSSFWLFNLIQMLERLAYSSVVLQMAVYISQKDLQGGLHFEHSTKGWIFFGWALIQNLTPILLGGLGDKYGRKRILFYSVLISIIGFVLIGLFRDVVLFSVSTLILGLGLGLFKPTLQGLMSNSMNHEQKSIGWGINVMLINLAVFLAPPLAKYLESFSWFWVFAGSGIVISLNFILLLFVKDNSDVTKFQKNSFIIKDAVKVLFDPKVLYFLLIMSGFAMIYMQFYETLPNFIYDWVDTSNVAKMLGLPESMLMKTGLGMMIDFKWLYSINSGLIVLFIVLVTWLISRYSMIYALMLGLILSTAGLFVSGASTYGSITIAGMVIYTFGEMITNPKITEFMSRTGDDTKRSLYMGLVNVSFGIGLAGGSLLGGFIYRNLGEKSGLALKYVSEKYPDVTNLNHSTVFEFLQSKMSLNYTDLTEMLFKTYNPQILWIPFIVIGLISIISLYFYGKKYFR